MYMDPGFVHGSWLCALTWVCTWNLVMYFEPGYVHGT